MTVSRPVKILALILVLAGVAGIASLKLLGSGAGGTAGTSTLSVDQIRARAHRTATTATTAASHHAAAPKPVAKPAAKPKPAAAKPVAKPKPSTPAVTTAKNGLPLVLADELHAHRIVVVSVFDPQSQTDAVSYAEARAGAADAHVGFLGVSVLDDTVAAPLTAALPGGGLLPLPGTLVYRAPGTLIERIDGFADRDSIAALALNARTAPPFTAPAPASTTPAAPVPAPVPTDTTTTP